MVKKLEERDVFVCEECGFGYKDKETAEECENFCRTHNSCSMEITKNAVYIPEE